MSAKLSSKTIFTAERSHGEMLCCIGQYSCCSVGKAVCPNGDEGNYQCRYNVLIRTALDQLQKEAKIHFVYDEENIDSG